MFHSAHAKNTTWQSALQDCLDELDEDLDATIGFVYVTDSIAPHLSSILEALKLKTGIDSWVGSASSGICSIGLSDAQEYFGVPAIAVMTADLPRTEFEVFQTIDTINSEDRVKPRENKQFISGTPLILLHADYANEDVLEIMDDISIRTEGYLIGGLTLSDTPKHHIAGEVTGGGVSGVIFNSSIGVVTSLSQGCRPIGKIHEVTECSENFIIGFVLVVNIFKLFLPSDFIRTKYFVPGFSIFCSWISISIFLKFSIPIYYKYFSWSFDIFSKCSLIISTFLSRSLSSFS